MVRSHLACLTASLAYLSSLMAIQPVAHAGSVLTIAGDGSADFFSIADAYAAAAEDDTLLIVGDPMDSAVMLDGKAVEVVMAPGVAVPLNEVRIENIPANRTALIRGIFYAQRLEIDACQGNVAILDSEFEFGKVLDSSAVTMKRSRVRGNGQVSIPAISGSSSFLVHQSSLLLAESRLNGQEGLPGHCGSGICTTCCSNGGTGYLTLRVAGGSYVRAEGSLVEGGYGGGVFGGLGNCSCSSGPDGQSYWVDPGSTLELLDTPTQSSTGSTGQALGLHGKARSASLPWSVDSGATLALELEGSHGDTIFLIAGEELVFRRATPSVGVFQVRGGQGRSRLGSLSPTEQLTASVTVPTAAPGTVERLNIQTVHLRPNGSVFLAPAAFVHVRGAGTPSW